MASSSLFFFPRTRTPNMVGVRVRAPSLRARSRDGVARQAASLSVLRQPVAPKPPGYLCCAGFWQLTFLSD